MPHAKDQGNQGSCVSFAITYMMTRNICLNNGWDPKDTNNMMSPAFIHNQFLKGAIINSEGLNFLTQNGICLWNDFPYNENDDTTQPCIESKYDAIKYRIADWEYTTSVETAKNWLYTYGPILTNINYSSGTKHSICLVGYDDNKIMGSDTGAFKYINSIGESWGENGYGWRSYNSQQVWGLYRVIEYYSYVQPYYIYNIEWNMADFVFNYNHKFYYVLDCDTIKIESLEPVGKPMINNFVLPIDDEYDEIIYKSNYTIITWDSTANFEIYNVSKYDNQQNYVYYETTYEKSIRDTIIAGMDYYVIDLDVILVIHDVITTIPKNKDLIKIYPTIFTDYINIILYTYEICRVEVFNTIGKLVYKTEKDNNFRLDLSNLPIGLYILRIEYNGEIINKKLIKSY